MLIPFYKMHGAGNDFIVVDDRKQELPLDDAEWLSRIAARKTGVGCEGVIAAQESESADFRMRFFNPDGNEVEMCGNGARCIARFAYDMKIATKHMTIETAAGTLEAEIRDNKVKLHMTNPSEASLGREIRINNKTVNYGFINTGVPHVVVQVPDLKSCDVTGMGSEIRYHNKFSPAGTNTNFVRSEGPQAISIRTYERGVEDETLACGTGITAGAIIAALSGIASPPVNVRTAGNDQLTVDFDVSGSAVSNVTLLGPAVYVFKGQLQYPASEFQPMV
jgi:diaminopimelate epimerase